MLILSKYDALTHLCWTFSIHSDEFPTTAQKKKRLRKISANLTSEELIKSGKIFSYLAFNHKLGSNSLACLAS